MTDIHTAILEDHTWDLRTNDHGVAIIIFCEGYFCVYLNIRNMRRPKFVVELIYPATASDFFENDLVKLLHLETLT